MAILESWKAVCYSLGLTKLEWAMLKLQSQWKPAVWLLPQQRYSLRESLHSVMLSKKPHHSLHLLWIWSWQPGALPKDTQKKDQKLTSSQKMLIIPKIFNVLQMGMWILAWRSAEQMRTQMAKFKGTRHNLFWLKDKVKNLIFCHNELGFQSETSLPLCFFQIWFLEKF